MSTHQFGLGKGHLSERARRAAKRAGATLVNYTGAQCSCGYGCRPYTCPKSARHWFESPNYGSPHDGQLASEVLAAIRQVATKTDRRLLGELPDAEAEL